MRVLAEVRAARCSSAQSLCGRRIRNITTVLASPGTDNVSLVPRPFFAREEKAAWYTLWAYSHKNLGIRARLHITATFERMLARYDEYLHVAR